MPEPAITTTGPAPATAPAASLAPIEALLARWKARGPYHSGAFYPEAIAHDQAVDSTYEGCAEDLEEALAAAADLLAAGYGPAEEIVFTPNRVSIDSTSYPVSERYAFRDDPVAHAGLEDLARLATSPHWQDRVRAEVLRGRLKVTLPDQFPCLYETADSPNKARVKNPQPFPWVVSPDLDMLIELLPDYQELWDAYTSQWGPDSRRTFAVGRLDGLTCHGVYVPGTTPSQVIGSTMLTHNGMYSRAPERLRRMHPMYATWNAGRPD